MAVAEGSNQPGCRCTEVKLVWNVDVSDSDAPLRRNLTCSLVELETEKGFYPVG